MALIRFILLITYAFSLMYVLLDCEIRHNKYRYPLMIFAVFMLAFAGFFRLKLGYDSFAKLYPLFIHLPVVTVFLILSKHKTIKVIFVYLTVFFLCAPPLLIGAVLASFWGLDKTLQNIIGLVMFIPTWFVVYRYLRPSFLYMLHNTDKGWFGFCTVPLSYFALVYFTAMYNVNDISDTSRLVIILLTTFLTFSAYLLILRFFIQTRENFILKNEQDLLKTQVTAAQVHLEALQDSQQKTLIYRHDMRHHLSLIDAYLADNNKEAAQRYLAEVENCIEDVVFEKYCNNYSVNLILSSYIAKAKAEGMTVEAQIDLPEKTALSDMDLCVIFANAIENAINACKNIPNPKDRTLKIVCKTKNNKPFIQITNSYEGKVEFINDMPVSTDENHGLGTRSIATIAQKYDGVYSFTAQDGLFQTSIIV